MGHYDWNTSIRLAALTSFFTNATRGLGTQEHYKYIDAAEESQVCSTLEKLIYATTKIGGQNIVSFIFVSFLDAFV